MSIALYIYTPSNVYPKFCHWHIDFFLKRGQEGLTYSFVNYIFLVPLATHINKKKMKGFRINTLYQSYTLQIKSENYETIINDKVARVMKIITATRWRSEKGIQLPRCLFCHVVRRWRLKPVSDWSNLLPRFRLSECNFKSRLRTDNLLSFYFIKTSSIT